MNKHLTKLTRLAALAVALLAVPLTTRAAASVDELLKATGLGCQKADNGVSVCFIELDEAKTVKVLVWETPLGEWKAGSVNVIAGQGSAAAIKAITSQLLKLQGQVQVGRIIVEESEGQAVVAYQVPFVVHVTTPEAFKVNLIAAVSFGPQIAAKTKLLLAGE
jgi:hypothetical protein